MSRFILFPALLLIMLRQTTIGQIPNSKKVNVDNLTPRNVTDSVDTLIEKKLVELALQSPVYKASGHQNRINELELRKTKSAWLNLLSVSYSANDQTFNKPDTPAATTLVYPKYNFGITVPLGIIFSQGAQIKSAREAIAYSRDMQVELARSIKADILSKYKQYKSYNVLIEMQSELINDVLANASQAEENFKNGTITVDVYITAQKTRNEELAKKMSLKLQQELLKLEMEKIIGVPLEEVLNLAKTPPH